MIPAEISFPGVLCLPGVLPVLFHREFHPQEKGIDWKQINWKQMCANWVFYLSPWRSVITTVPGRVDSQAGDWVTFLLCASFPQLMELRESLGVLQLSPLCLRSSAPNLQREPFVAGAGYFARTGRGVLLIHTAWSGQHVTVAKCQEDFRGTCCSCHFSWACDLSCDRDTA